MIMAGKNRGADLRKRDDALRLHSFAHAATPRPGGACRSRCSIRYSILDHSRCISRDGPPSGRPSMRRSDTSFAADSGLLTRSQQSAHLSREAMGAEQPPVEQIRRIRQHV